MLISLIWFLHTNDIEIVAPSLFYYSTISNDWISFDSYHVGLVSWTCEYAVPSGTVCCVLMVSVHVGLVSWTCEYAVPSGTVCCVLMVSVHVGLVSWTCEYPDPTKVLIFCI